MFTKHTPYHRFNHSIWCNCSDCKQFDYANTVLCSTPKTKTATRQNRVKPVSPVLYEVVDSFTAYDTETSEKHTYLIVEAK